MISPLLANLYMRRLVLGWHLLGHAQRWQARIVNYADDLVICGRGSAAQALTALRSILAKLKLTLHEGKTRICRLPGDTFDFLGFTFRRRYRYDTGQASAVLSRVKPSVCLQIRGSAALFCRDGNP